MPISDTTIKRLFAKSHNQCAMPRCKAAIIIGNCVVGEICHIRARRKGGTRYDPNLTAEQKDDFHNLILLCRTCHKLIDGDCKTYTVELLEDIKEMHERGVPMEIDVAVARQALMILANHTKNSRKTINQSPVQGVTRASASNSGVAIAIGGHNQAPINVRIPPKKPSGTRYPANSIGADANMTNYIEYLCQLYVDYMSPIEPDRDRLWATIGRHIKNRFRLRKRTRNHLSADRFHDLVDYLVTEKLSNTPVGSKHLRNGTKLCRSFDEFRHCPM